MGFDIVAKQIIMLAVLMLLGFIGFWNDYSVPLLYLPSYPTVALGMYKMATTTDNSLASVPMRMTGAMLSAILLKDKLIGRQNNYAEFFRPGRSILHPQLFVNGFESLTNLLTFSQKRCPHLGCALKWNSAEHSWDCPCHGSRFDESGKILDNPANGNMNI